MIKLTPYGTLPSPSNLEGWWCDHPSTQTRGRRFLSLSKLLGWCLKLGRGSPKLGMLNLKLIPSKSRILLFQVLIFGRSCETLDAAFFRKHQKIESWVVLTSKQWTLKHLQCFMQMAGFWLTCETTKRAYGTMENNHAAWNDHTTSVRAELAATDYVHIIKQANSKIPTLHSSFPPCTKWLHVLHVFLHLPTNRIHQCRNS